EQFPVLEFILNFSRQVSSQMFGVSVFSLNKLSVYKTLENAVGVNVVKWLPDTSYVGEQVVFQKGKLYRSIQNHTSSDSFDKDVEKMWEEIYIEGRKGVLVR